MIGNREFKKIELLVKKRREEHSEPYYDYFLGQPHLPINPAVLSYFNRSQNFLRDECLGYLPVKGREETLEVLERLLQRYFPNLRPKKSQVLCTHGATQANFNALSSLIIPHTTKVLCFTPYFPLFKDQVLELKGLWIEIPTNRQMKPSLKKLEHFLIIHEQEDLKISSKNLHKKTIQGKKESKSKNKTKTKNNIIFILNNPHNPTGYVWSPEQLEQLACIAKKYPHLIILQDEVYRDLSYQKFTSLLEICPEIFNQVVSTYSCSKALIGAPDLRVGFSYASEALTQSMAQKQLKYSAQVNLFSQKALCAAIDAKLNSHESSLQWEQNTLDVYQKHKKILLREILKLSPQIKICCEPQAGFFLLLDFSNLRDLFFNFTQRSLLDFIGIEYEQPFIRTDLHLSYYLLTRFGVLLCPGSFLGLDKRKMILRLSFACPLKKLNYLIKVLSSLKETKTYLGIESSM